MGVACLTGRDAALQSRDAHRNNAASSFCRPVPRPRVAGDPDIQE